MFKIFQAALGIFKNGDVAAWVAMAYELFDYMVKAAVHYKDTEQGAKEWSDFSDRFEVLVNNEANTEVSFGVEPAQKSAASMGEYDNPKGGRK